MPKVLGRSRHRATKKFSLAHLGDDAHKISELPQRTSTYSQCTYSYIAELKDMDDVLQKEWDKRITVMNRQIRIRIVVPYFMTKQEIHETGFTTRLSARYQHTSI
jgi:hypothetical protein